MTTLAQIHDRYYPDVYRYARYRLDDEQACEDIASEVFVRLLDALQTHRGPDHNLRGWLLGTASNLINDHLRLKYKNRLENFEDDFEIAAHDNPERSFENSWTRQEIQKAVQQLTEEQQHVLALRFAEELSIEETADLMRKSVNAVKALQFRAIASLRRLLEVRF